MINKRLKDALFTDQWSELFMDALAPFNFVLVTPPSGPWIPGSRSAQTPCEIPCALVVGSVK